MNLEWNMPYLDRLRWILGNMENLHADPREITVLMLIEYFNEIHEEVTHERISAKSGLSVEEIEEIFMALSEKGYLSVAFSQGRLSFLLDGLLENRSAGSESLNRSLIEEFELEFGRGLSPVEMQRILDLAAAYDERRVIVALNEAASYDKRSFTYIENILASWKKKGLSIEDLENGRR